MTVAAYDEIIKDILDRMVLIDQTLVNPATNRPLDSVARFWMPNDVFPMIYNKYSGVIFDDASKMGAPLWQDDLQFTKRLVVGSLNAGYTGESEDNLNRMIYQVVNRYRIDPGLMEPGTGKAFRYLKPGRNSVRLTSIPNGSSGYTFVAGGPLFLGCDFQLTVSILVELGRRTGQPTG